MHHSKQTIRGGSELAAGEETSQEGLALDYATAWSYGRAESWNLLIPDFMGGDSGRAFTRDGKVAEALKPYGLEGIAEQLPAYWGSSPTLPDRPTWRRRPVPGSAGTPAGIGTQQVVDRSRQSADAFVGLGT